ncbi:unnamed protein product [Sphenostylis stenocarpa]|uniref:Uncharacterized protein n=1 Tax=Sphenostylis stenocarpa TaxID=92480 RepID=A0AA86SGH8_9FABA|nr:unnamed protein product [Sphenostylis stenocarpa]
MITGKIGGRPHVVAVHVLLLGESNDVSVSALPVEKLIVKADGLGEEFPETGQRPGMGTNIYPSSDETRMFLFKENFLVHHDNISKFHVKPSALPDRWKLREIFVAGVVLAKLISIDLDVDVEMITDDQLAIAKKMGRRKHTLELFVADCARSVSDIGLTELDLNVIISAQLTSRAISQMMKNYSIYAVSITIRRVGYIMTISKFHVKPSPLPDSWKLRQIFVTDVVLGSYFAFKLEPQMTVIFLPHE